MPASWQQTIADLRARAGDRLGEGLRGAIGANLAELEDGSSLLAAFYGGATGVLNAVEVELKECVTIALLAERRATQNLAVHLLLAALAGVPDAKVDAVLAIVGVYGGAGTLTDALETRRALRSFLADLRVDDLPADPVAMFTEVLVRLRGALAA